MPKIIIKEADLTNPVQVTDSMDVVYIPGFSDLTPSDETYVVGEPELITNLTYFRAHYGEKPFNFDKDAFIAAWDPDAENYSQYTIVIFDGKYYVNITGEPDPDGKDPSEDTTNWATNVVDAWDDDATGYPINTMVSYDGKIYVHTSATIVVGTNPSVDTENWATNGNITNAGKYLTYGVDVVVDSAYVYAVELLKLGLPICYEVVDNGEGGRCETVAAFYANLGKAIGKLTDRGSYYVKYLTSGGYPILVDSTTTTLITAFCSCAAKRGDAVALIDHVQSLEEGVDSGSVFDTVNAISDDAFKVAASDDFDGNNDTGTYGAVLTPWQPYQLGEEYIAGDVTISKFDLPASFAYLACLGNSVKNNPSYLAIAGTQRGVVPFTIGTSQLKRVTCAMADAFMTYGGSEQTEGRSINGITNIRNYGLTIWGNRTLAYNSADRKTGAFAYLNMRNLVCDVKKTVYAAAQRFMFEQNNDILWLNFKSAITPTLDKMATGGGISQYKIVKQKCPNSTRLKATIVLYPIYAVEEFEVGIEMTNEDITVSE